MPALLSAGEVATRANVSLRTVYRWARRGSLAYVKLPGGDYRFAEATVAALLAEKVRLPAGRHRAGARSAEREARTARLLAAAGQPS